MPRSLTQEFTKGLWDEVPPFRLVLGLCPTLAVTKTLENGIGMGVATTFVLVFSNVLVSFYSGYRHLRDRGRASLSGVCIRIVFKTGYFYSADSRKLHRTRPVRSLRLQIRCFPFAAGRVGNRYRIHSGTGPAGLPPRSVREWKSHGVGRP